MMETITSRQNPLCVHFRKLASSRSYREERGEFLCDSPKLLREAELWGAKIKTVLYTAGATLPDFHAERTVEVSQGVMEAVSPMEAPQGVVFSCAFPSRNTLPQRLVPGHYLVLDAVQDPGNVGTILRTADAFDTTVLLLPGCADLYNPKTLRAGMGVHFRRVVYQCGREELSALLKRSDIPLYATALREDTQDIRRTDLSRCAVVVGSEGRGVSAEMLSLAEKTLKIPMEDTCESLNAAVAAAVVLWEGYRQQG